MGLEHSGSCPDHGPSELDGIRVNDWVFAGGVRRQVCRLRVNGFGCGREALLRVPGVVEQTWWWIDQLTPVVESKEDAA